MESMSRTHVNGDVERWTPDTSAPLWSPDESSEGDGPFFHELDLEHAHQVGPTCVPTTLAILAQATGADVRAEDFMRVINSQAPHTWSEALAPYGMQLAYCNTDHRRLEYYIDELVELDDLFLVCFYSYDPPSDPDFTGRLCTSHIVTMHRDRIYDTAPPCARGVCSARDYGRNHRQTKRIFRVVPVGHPRRV